MRIADHKIVKSFNGTLRRMHMQELTEHEAEVLVLYFLKRHLSLELTKLLPYREVCQHMPVTYYMKLLEVVSILMDEILDLVFTMRGIESLYCLKGRYYHENREGNSEVGA